MKLTIKTNLMKDMVGRAIKCCSFKKGLPETSLLSIEVKNGNMSMLSTDMTNYLLIKAREVQAEPFSVTVDADSFYKLVSKTTSESMTLNFDENTRVLEIKGNGTYKMQLPLDDNGELKQIHIPYADNAEKIATINLSTVKLILKTGRAALASNDPTSEFAGTCYTSYYMGDSIISTDTAKLCNIGVSLFNEPILIGASTLDLFSCMTQEKIEVCKNASDISFLTEDCDIYSHVQPDIDQYAVSNIMDLVNQNFESSGSVSKGEILAVLDRLSLFVGPYDDGVVVLNFTPEGLKILNKDASSYELLEYKDSRNFKPFTCYINQIMLNGQIKAQTGDLVEFWYGNEGQIAMKDGNVTQIIALEEDN